MPLVEVEDNVLAALREHKIAHTDRTAQIAPTAQAAAEWQKILGNAETRPEGLRLWKKLNPDAVIPELDAAKPYDDRLSAFEKKFDDFLTAQTTEREEAAKKRAEADANDTVSKGRSWLRGQKKLDDEGVKGVEDIMTEFGIPNYEVAYSHWHAQQPPEPATLPQSTIGRDLNWFKAQENQPDHALMLKDPVGWRRQEIMKTLQGIRSGEIAA
jgi:hypothetical protein